MLRKVATVCLQIPLLLAYDQTVAFLAAESPYCAALAAASRPS